MIATRQLPMTVEAFDVFADMPENSNRNLEFIGGEVHEVPSNAYASMFSAKFAFWIMLFLQNSAIEAFMTTEAGGYQIAGERYSPDIAVILKSRQAELDKRGYNRISPDLAIEVVYPDDTKSMHEFSLKVGNYLAAGATLVGVFPENKRIYVYAPGQPVRILGIDDMLDNLAMLPGFTLNVGEVFEG